MFQLFGLPTALCACIFAIVSDARSIIPQRHGTVAQQHHGNPEGQQPLFVSDDFKTNAWHRQAIPPPQHVNVMEHFDARENSVGIIFTTASGEDEAVHLWLPLGKRVFTRDCPILPLHPVTALITTLITTNPSLAESERLDSVRCELWTTARATVPGFGVSATEARNVSFTRRDGLVRFVKADDERFWLAGGELESYECHV